MRVGITAKLFLALLAVSILTVLATSVATRISFTRGFLGYMNEQGIERVETLLPIVSAAYKQHGSWEFLRRDRRAWYELLRAGSEEVPGQTPRTPPSTELMGLDLRIGLIDTQGRFITGNPDIGPDSARRKIRVNGETVGFLVVVPYQKIGGGADLRFQVRQLRTTWLIAAASVLLAAILAVWLAKRLLARLTQVTNSVHRLAAGDFTVRVDAPSRDEIGLLAQDCNRLAQALERTQQARREFMSDVSHELRTPLAVLRGELEAIEDGVRQLTKESIRSLQGEVATLAKLVDDLHSLSYSDAGTLAYRMEPLDLCRTLHLVADSFRDRFAEKSIGIELREMSPVITVRADLDRLRQLLANILENTLRYTDRDGMLRIACRTEGGMAVVDFQDTAPGVPDSLLPRLFERFYRVEASRNRATGGSGLGLAISKKIVEAHGGDISARRSPIGGLWITVKLPLASL